MDFDELLDLILTFVLVVGGGIFGIILLGAVLLN